MLWGDCQACNGVDEAKDKVTPSKPADIYHGPSQTGLYNAITHTNDKEKEEGEGVSCRIEHCDYYHQNLGAYIRTVSIHVIYTC